MRSWAYLATAPNQVVAEMWQDMLQQEGVPALLQPADAISFIGVTSRPVRVMVAPDKLADAQKLLADWESQDSGEEEPEEEPEKGTDPQGR